MVSHVRFLYTETAGVSIDRIVPQGAYATQNNINTACKVTVYYKSSLDNDLKGTTRTTGNKLTLYAIYNDGPTNNGTDRLLALNVSLQDCSCCDGAVVLGGAFDYANGSSGAWAMGKTSVTMGQDNTGITPNNNMGGEYNSASYANNFLPYFQTTPAGDLCWYKKDAPSGINWSAAIINCANGTYTDGDANGGWYLPNLRELDYLYRSQVGTPGDNWQGDAAFFGGSADAAAFGAYNFWSSTEGLTIEDSTGHAYQFAFNGYRVPYNKGYNYNIYSARCVRRL
jgi:hypothetical protein